MQSIVVGFRTQNDFEKSKTSDAEVYQDALCQLCTLDFQAIFTVYYIDRVCCSSLQLLSPSRGGELQLEKSQETPEVFNRDAVM